MSPESSSSNDQASTPRTIAVPAPIAGQNLTVTSAPDSALQFAFDPTQNTSYERVDNSLVFTSDVGGQVTIVDFFVVGDQSLPTFVLPGGTVVPADFLASAGVDITTAAGPSNAASNTSGGSGEYDDDGGSILDGVGRLDSLGTDQWGRETEAPEALQTLQAQAAVGGTGGGGGNVTPAAFAFQARAVLYMHDDVDGYGPVIPRDVGIRLLEKNSGQWTEAPGIPDPNAITQVADAPDPDVYQYLRQDQYPDGSIRFSLTPDGYTWMANNPGQDILAYYKVTDAHGNSYVMQVVVSADEIFDSTDMSKAYNDALDPSGLIYGEWHGSRYGSDPNGGTAYQITSTALADELSIVDGTDQAVINTGAGNDTLDIGHQVTNSTIDMGTGFDHLLIGASAGSDNGGISRITMEDGELSINRGYREGSLGLYADNGGETIAKVGDAEVKIGAISDFFNASYAVKASNGGKVTLETTDSVTIKADSSDADKAAHGVYAETYGEVNLSAAKIDIQATSEKGEAYGAYASGDATINLTGSDITIKGSTTDAPGVTTIKTAGIYVRDPAKVAIDLQDSANGPSKLDIQGSLTGVPKTGAIHGIFNEQGTVEITGADGNSNKIDIGGTSAGNARGIYTESFNGNMAVTTITGGSGNDTITVKGTSTGAYEATGIQSNALGKTTINTGGGQDSVEIIADSKGGKATGILSSQAGTYINGDAADTVLVKATTTGNGEATGILSQISAGTKITAGDIKVEATADTGNAIGMHVTRTAVGTLDAGATGSVKVDASGNGHVFGAISSEGSALNITGKTLDITATSTSTASSSRTDSNQVNAVRASNAAGSGSNPATVNLEGNDIEINAIGKADTLQAAGITAMEKGSAVNVTLTDGAGGARLVSHAESTKDVAQAAGKGVSYASGVFAQNGSVTVKGAELSANDMEFSGKGAVAQAFGISALQNTDPDVLRNQGINTAMATKVSVTGGDKADTINIHGESEHFFAAGIFGANKAEILVDAKGGANEINISGKSDSFFEVNGVRTLDATTTINGGNEGTVTISAATSSTAFNANAVGVLSGDHGKTEITGKNINIIASTGTDRSERALEASNSGENIINAQNKVSLEGDMFARINGVNTVNANEVKLVGEMRSESGGQNIINGTAGDDTITITTKEYSTAMSAEGMGSSNSINAGEGNNTVLIGVNDKDATTTDSWMGMFSYKTEVGGTVANSIVTGNGNDTIVVGGQLAGMRAINGTNTINAGDGENDIRVFSGMSSDKKGTNLIESGNGNDTITVTGKAASMMAHDASFNTIRAGNGDNVITLSGGGEAAMSSYRNPVYAPFGGINSIYAGDGADTINISGVNAGMRGEGLNSINFIDAGGGDNHITVSATNTGPSVAAMFAKDGAQNQVQASGLGNDIFEINGSMKVEGGGANLIITGQGDDTVSINGGLISSGTGSANTVTHGPGGTSGSITVYLTAVTGSFAMLAENGASNQISGSQGDDIIKVIGAIGTTNGGRNLITTAGGDDRIYLDGEVGIGGLGLLAGDGFDVLVLQANGLSEFNARYQAWFTSLSSDYLQMGRLGIESIQVEGVDSLSDIAWLQTIANNNNIHLSIYEYVNDSDLSSLNAQADHSYDVDVHGASLENAHLTLSDGDDRVVVEGGMLHANINTGDGTDNVHITGTVEDSIIKLGNGGDHLTLNGDLSHSSIDLGTGDDQLTLHGFTSGTIDGGAGNDALILKLEGHAADGLTDAGIFKGMFDGNGQIEGFESLRLDLSGGTADTLNITADAINSLKAAGENSATGELKVFITGDAASDHVTLDNGWTQGSNSIGADGLNYTTYTHGTGPDELQVLIQSNLLS